jgi:hypothetical protein
MIVCICGSRGFTDYEQICAVLATTHIDKVISGGAHGADSLGERYAEEHGAALEIIRPQWNKHGKAAGMIRNRQMADMADHVFAFWDGKSPGTKGMIDYCKSKNRPIEVHLYEYSDNEKK